MEDHVTTDVDAENLPVIHQGEAIEIRDAAGNWHRTIALSEVRIDRENAPRRSCAWPTVSVMHRALGREVNWPATDVRLAPEAEGEDQ